MPLPYESHPIAACAKVREWLEDFQLPYTSVDVAIVNGKIRAYVYCTDLGQLGVWLATLHRALTLHSRGVQLTLEEHAAGWRIGVSDA